MPTAVTYDIEVSVATEFQPDYSSKAEENFFAYDIRIENHSGYTVQLLRRHWHIFDSNGDYREVEGEGVVGLQPVLEPGQVHTYSSACNLHSDIGKMHGTYLFERLADGEQFRVHIPEFFMVAPFRLN